MKCWGGNSFEAPSKSTPCELQLDHTKLLLVMVKLELASIVFPSIPTTKFPSALEKMGMALKGRYRLHHWNRQDN